MWMSVNRRNIVNGARVSGCGGVWPHGVTGRGCKDIARLYERTQRTQMVNRGGIYKASAAGFYLYSFFTRCWNFCLRSSGKKLI